MELTYVRLKPYNPAVGNVIRNWTHRNLGTFEGGVWYKITDPAALEIIKAARQFPANPNSPPAFDCCDYETANRIATEERYRREANMFGVHGVHHPDRAGEPRKAQGLPPPRPVAVTPVPLEPAVKPKPEPADLAPPPAVRTEPVTELSEPEAPEEPETAEEPEDEAPTKKRSKSKKTRKTSRKRKSE